MKKYQELFKQAEAKFAAVSEVESQEEADRLMEEGDALLKKGETLKAAAERMDKMREPQRNIPLPVDDDAGNEPAPPRQETKTFNPAYVLRYGEPDAAVKAVLRDLHGEDYEEKRWKKDLSFNRWLKNFQDPIVPSEGRIFLWTPNTIKLALKEGQDVAAMKTTMVEAQDTLGGYLVPEDYRAQLIERLMGFTIVRPRATIVTTSRDAIEFPTGTGGGSQYTGAVRVTWVDETPASASTSATNATFGLKRVPVHTVMANVDLSQNLVEDAAFNLAGYLNKQFGEAAAIDEDNQFLTGDGNGKPLGLLPSSGNANSFSTANSGNASALTWDGLIALMYAIDGQYRQRSVWIGEKATYEAIAKLKDSNGQYLWRERFGNQVSEGAPVSARLMGYEALEQEAMPTIAGSAYPLLFGQLSAYYIVDRVGMSINRYVDGTLAATNQVRYVLRRRLGGQCLEPYRFVAQYVSA